MVRIFKSFDAQGEPSARRDRSARCPRRTRIGLKALADRQVPSALLASAAVAAHDPGGPLRPARAVQVPPDPCMPTFSARFIGSSLLHGWWFLLVVALTCGAPTARAGSCSVHAFVSAYADGAGSQSVDTGEIPGPTATAGPIDLVLVSPDREASIFAQASYGYLTANAFATNPTSGAAAQAVGNADDFMDTLTPVSSTLPSGSSVHVLASVTFDNVLTGAGDTGVGEAGLTLGYALTPLGSYRDSGGNGTFSNHHQNSVVLTELVDTPFLISASLGFAASARPGMGQVQADATITLDVLTPGATLESASGTSYSSGSVPEPSSLAMLAGGLCGLGLLSKWAPGGRSRKALPR